MTAYGDGFVDGYFWSWDPNFRGFLETLVNRHLVLVGVVASPDRVLAATDIVRRAFQVRMGQADSFDLRAPAGADSYTVARAIDAWELQGLIDGLVHRAQTRALEERKAEQREEAKQREIATTA